MSLGIAFKGPEGIVLAADSRVTLSAERQKGQLVTVQTSTYDNATKLLRVTGLTNVGAVTYGLGAIGQQQPRTAHSYIPEFEEELAKEGITQLTVPDFALKLSNFFMKQWTMAMPDLYQGPDMAFLVGGFDDGAAYGRVHEFHIPRKPSPIEWHAGSFGMVWGGQREFADRIIRGFDEGLLEAVKNTLNLSADQVKNLAEGLPKKTQAPIPFAFLPLQDCVDLSIFLIRATISIQSWLVGIRGVGGAIDVATITRTDGFTDVQKKSIQGERN